MQVNCIWPGDYPEPDTPLPVEMPLSHVRLAQAQAQAGDAASGRLVVNAAHDLAPGTVLGPLAG